MSGRSKARAWLRDVTRLTLGGLTWYIVVVAALVTLAAVRW